jgi:hypothetical protein
MEVHYEGKGVFFSSALVGYVVMWYDFSNEHLVTRFYISSLVMSLNYPSLLWPSAAKGLGDITSSSVATVTIW